MDNPADPALYRLVAEGFPRAWIEDPDLRTTVTARRSSRTVTGSPGTRSSTRSPTSRRFRSRRGGLNIKPSRFGSLKALLDTYDYCAARGIVVYGGGQFELGPGRGQIQYLASLFHPGSPNDVAPAGYNDPAPGPGLPVSPLAPEPVPNRLPWAANRCSV